MAFWEGDRIYLGTRNGKEWTAPRHIAKELENILPKEMVLDGELYIHGVDFESLSSWTKKIYKETAQLEYWVFDIPIDEEGNSELPWNKRRQVMEQFFNTHGQDGSIKMVSVFGKAKNHQEVLDLEEKCVAEGYEGVMVRNMNGKYLFGHRSHDLLKVKSSEDAEYKIADF